MATPTGQPENGDFETGDLTGWVVYKYPAGTTVTVSAEAKYGGAYGLKVDTTKTYSGGTYYGGVNSAAPYYITFKMGDTISVTYWRSDNSAMRCVIDIYQNATYSNRWIDENAESGWQTFTITPSDVLISGIHSQLLVWFFITGAPGHVWGYIDNVVIMSGGGGLEVGGKALLIPFGNAREYVAVAAPPPIQGGKAFLIPLGNKPDYVAVDPGALTTADNVPLLPLGNKQLYVPIKPGGSIKDTWYDLAVMEGTVTPWDANDPNFNWCTSIPAGTPWTTARVGYSSGPSCVNGVTVWSSWPPRTPDPAVGYWHRHTISKEWHFEHSGATTKTTYVAFQYGVALPPGVKQFRFTIDGNTLGLSRWNTYFYGYECSINYGVYGELVAAGTFTDQEVYVDHRTYGQAFLTAPYYIALFSFLTTVPAGGGTMDLTVRTIQYQVY